MIRGSPFICQLILLSLLAHIMHVAIIGAGFTGLTAGLRLVQAGHTVTIFEKESIPGGLAVGFKKDNWDWDLEKHYHHIFTSDTSIRALSQEIGISFAFSRPNTSSLVEGDILQLDSPLKLLQFSKLTVPERIRMGAVLAYLKYASRYEDLEQYTAHAWLTKQMGKRPYELLWEPLLISKFGSEYQTISLAWFWARIKARTTQLGYPDKGFQHVAYQIAEAIRIKGGNIRYNTSISQIEQTGSETILHIESGKERFDQVLVTVPNALFAHLTPQLPRLYQDKLLSFQGIGAVNMVLELDESFFHSDVYWLSVCEKEYPFLAVVEHTHFADKVHYGNSHIVYVGNYVPADHPFMSKSPDELLEVYDPYLTKLNPTYREHIKSINVFSVPFAQPIVPIHFSRKLLPFETPLDRVFLANMQQVYPWDRGTNFAVEMGERVAQKLIALHGTIRT